jgi:hypothetical protein
VRIALLIVLGQWLPLHAECLSAGQYTDISGLPQYVQFGPYIDPDKFCIEKWPLFKTAYPQATSYLGLHQQPWHADQSITIHYCSAKITKPYPESGFYEGSYGYSFTVCTRDRKTSLTLSPAPNQKDPRPDPRPTDSKDKLPASSTYELIAKVMEGNTAKPGVGLTFNVDVIPMSGGHEHHDANRPKGSLSSASGTTDSNGEFKFTFQAPIVSGIHKIKATCSVCTNEAELEIKVKVPDLVPINPNPPRQANGSFAYALTSVDNIHQGTSRYHVGQYWLTKDASDSLRELIRAFNDFGWGTVALNDASLIWGGVYDIFGNWRNPHSGHRTGEEIDISFKRAGNVVSPDRQNATYKEFCLKNNAAMPFNILHHFVVVPHFHVYLRKQKPCALTEK